MHKVLYRLEVFWLALSHLFRRNHTANLCKHKTKRIGTVTSHGKSYVLSMPLSDNNSPDYCLDCIAKMAIRCAWCGDVIRIGDPVTLYVPNKLFRVPEYAVRYDEDPECLVGCLGWDCCNTGADRQGFWIPLGKVKRIPSPIEMMMMPGNQGKIIIVRDLSDPNDVGQVVPK